MRRAVSEKTEVKCPGDFGWARLQRGFETRVPGTLAGMRTGCGRRLRHRRTTARIRGRDPGVPRVPVPPDEACRRRGPQCRARTGRGNSSRDRNQVGYTMVAYSAVVIVPASRAPAGRFQGSRRGPRPHGVVPAPQDVHPDETPARAEFLGAVGEEGCPVGHGLAAVGVLDLTVGGRCTKKWSGWGPGPGSTSAGLMRSRRSRGCRVGRAFRRRTGRPRRHRRRRGGAGNCAGRTPGRGTAWPNRWWEGPYGRR